MGINRLLPFLENSSRSVHISHFRGCTAAIDSYCWLHKGTFGCCEKLARGEDTNGYVLYCLKYIRILQNAGVRPIMVFDGRHLPAKRETEEKRREQRKIARKRAAELLRLDRANEARNYLRQCIDVTHDMALALIKECRQMGVDCIVAPYEADAQLAYLNLKKIADVVITEDSDLVLFGCDKILFKLDLLGQCTLVEREKLYLSMQMSPDVYTFDKFRYMCILSGCDYIQSLPGIGLKKALKFIKLTANPEIYQILSKLPSYLNMRQIVVTNEYKEEFMVALATFKHQIVFDPLTRKLIHLTDPESCGTPKEHCRNAGDFFDEETAFQLALGNIDPFSLKKVDDWNPDKAPLKFSSIWSRDYRKIVKEIKPPSPSLLRKVKSTKSVDVTIQVKSLSVVEKDDDFQEELQIYKTTKVETVEEIDYKSKEKEENIVKSTVNERKSFNPFIKENRMARTTIDPNRIVRSRFFSKTNSNTTTDSCSSDETSGYFTQESTTLTEQNSVTNSDLKDSPVKNLSPLKERFSPEKNEKQSPIENIDILCDVIEMEAKEEAAMKNNIHNETTSSNKTSISERFSLERTRRKIVFLESKRPTTVETESDEIVLSCSTEEEEEKTASSPKAFDRVSLDKRKRSVSTDEEIDNGNDSNVENLTPPCRTSTSQIVKKSNTGPCRSFGLRKKTVKKMAGKNQPTLLSMFAAIKK